MHSVCLSVYLSVRLRTKTLVNVLQMPCNVCMLFITDVKCSGLKVVMVANSGEMWLRVRLHRHTKVFGYISAYRGKIVKNSLTNLYCTKYNEITICRSDVQKHVSYTGSRKKFLI